MDHTYRQKIIAVFAFIVTVLTFTVPFYLFSNEVKAGAENGWNFYRQNMEGVSLKINDWKEKANLEFLDTNSGKDENEDLSEGDMTPMGKVKVVTPQANIRSTPRAESDDNIYTVADEGQVFPYYEKNHTDGDLWYQLVTKQGETYWISEHTVEVVE
ncbi:MAG: SH3 domain-containing protein [Bacillota bacterium]